MKIIYEFVYDVRDIKTKEKITNNDRFCIVSRSKSILNTAITKESFEIIIKNNKKT